MKVFRFRLLRCATAAFLAGVSACDGAKFTADAQPDTSSSDAADRASDSIDVVVGDVPADGFDTPITPDVTDAIDASCDGARTLCGAACVDLRTDPANCGACGSACPPGGICTGGTCIACGCSAGLICCGPACVDLRTDLHNCGACGTVCPSGDVCNLGVCQGVDAGSDGAASDAVDDCGSPLTSCAGVCVDTQTDWNNCGGCGIRCCSPWCLGGVCSTEGPSGTSACPSSDPTCTGPITVNLSFDPNNCGSCGNRCASGETCVDGMCISPPDAASDAGDASDPCAPLTSCGGACVDITTDPANCGACGTTCPTGDACLSGTCHCGCSTPYATCGSACVDLQTDPANCGTCGNACTAGACVSGSCTSSCSSPRSNCAGSCVDTATDPANCGACGNACPAGRVCQLGVCC